MKLQPLRPINILIGVIIGLALAWLTGCSFTPDDNSQPDATAESDASVDVGVDASSLRVAGSRR